MFLDPDEIILISENQTRKQLIDPLLAEMGWLKKYIKEEVNFIKSDFNDKNFVHFNVNIIESGVDRFIDYVLLDDDFTIRIRQEALLFEFAEGADRSFHRGPYHIGDILLGEAHVDKETLVRFHADFV